MNKMHVSKLSDIGQRFFELIEFDENEELFYEIRKDSFGLFLIYAVGTFVTISLLVLIVVAGRALDGDALNAGVNLSPWRPIVVIGGGVLALLSVGATFLGAYLYKSNVVFVTSEKIAQVLYKSLFDRKISQLSIGDVQDVTVNQKGIFARMFNYGTIVVETAGEQQNYTFSFTPDPYIAAKQIVGAHERNLTLYGN